MFDAALNHDCGVISDRAIDAIVKSNSVGTMRLSETGLPASAEDASSLATSRPSSRPRTSRSASSSRTRTSRATSGHSRPPTRAFG